MELIFITMEIHPLKTFSITFESYHNKFIYYKLFNLIKINEPVY